MYFVNFLEVAFLTLSSLLARLLTLVVLLLADSAVEASFAGSAAVWVP
ncbi:hypothetical protein [Lentilactobacillus kisonensis]|nr:hypothetical protein [Lentilactobacillus kisonensis]